MIKKLIIYNKCNFWNWLYLVAAFSNYLLPKELWGVPYFQALLLYVKLHEYITQLTKVTLHQHKQDSFTILL